MRTLCRPVRRKGSCSCPSPQSLAFPAGNDLQFSGEEIFFLNLVRLFKNAAWHLLFHRFFFCFVLGVLFLFFKSVCFPTRRSSFSPSMTMFAFFSSCFPAQVHKEVCHCKDRILLLLSDARYPRLSRPFSQPHRAAPEAWVTHWYFLMPP